MLSHFHDLMADGEAYGWSVVLIYHTAWLQHLEQGRAVWRDHCMKLKLRHSLVWHRIAPTPGSPAATSQTGKNPIPSNRSQRKAQHLCELANSGSTACVAFLQGQCVDSTSHPAELRIFRCCLYTVNKRCYLTEQFCNRKGFSKYGAVWFKSGHPYTEGITSERTD